MSAQQLQKAMVRLIRYPQDHRGDASESFVREFELTESERWQLRALATNFRVSKFGKEQRFKRFRTYVRHLFPLTVRTIGEDKAQEIFNRRFEPAHPVMHLREIPTAFFRFCLESDESLRADFGYPEFVTDLLRYEYAEYALHWQLVDSASRVPSESRLEPKTSFLLLELAFDISTFAERLKSGDPGETEALFPEKTPTIVLSVKVPKPEAPSDYVFSQFLIDRELKEFLETQLRDPGSSTSLPSCYSDLVELGLCKPLIEQ